MRALLLSVLAAAGAAAAQQPDFRSRTDLVRVDVLVERDGRPVTGLTAADFVVEDAGVPQRAQLLPVSEAVGVSTVLDVSGSMSAEQLAKAAAAADAIAANLREGDRQAVYAVAGGVREEAAGRARDGRVFVNDLAYALRAGSGSSTSLFDALHVAIVRGLHTAAPDLVLVLTDGHDNTSWLSAASVIDTAIRLETVICVVTIRQPPPWATDPPVAADAGLRLAQVLADRTGGRVVHADWTRDLGPAFTTLLDAYRQRYILSFAPEGVKREDGWHPLSVKLRNRSGRVHARNGYWSR
jgi:VWFA-related protein